MAGGIGILGGFLGGLGDGIQTKKDREQAKIDGERADRMLSIYEANPGLATGGGMGAVNASASGTGGMGAPQQGGIGVAPTGGGAGGSDLWSLLTQHEGAGQFDTLYGHAQNGGRFDNIDVSTMTLDQLYEFSDPSGEYGQWVKANNPEGVVATPMGAGQIVGTTLRSTAAGMGLPGSTVYSPDVQRSMIGYLAQQRLAGASSPAAERAGLRAEWAGFRNVSDAALDAAIAQFKAQGGSVQGFTMGAARPRQAAQ